MKDLAKMLVALAAGFFLMYVFGYYQGRDSVKIDLSETTCVNDEYVIIDRTDCHLMGFNMTAGWMDASIPGFSKFDQIKVCGLWDCKGDAQGEYGCFERNKLRKQAR